LVGLDDGSTHHGTSRILDGTRMKTQMAHLEMDTTTVASATEDALDGLRAIGFLEAASPRLRGASRERSKREAQLDATRADVSDLDDQFHDLEKTGALDVKMLAFARKHADDFDFVGTVERLVAREQGDAWELN
jgi:hypothetical protein